MRSFLLLLLTVAYLCGHELIYISNDASEQSLERLHRTYRQTLLVNTDKVYLIPPACRLERYFGGASQIPLKLDMIPEQTEKVIITQEVFKAKDKSAIQEKIEVEKSIALIEGTVPKAFLDDKEGRGYGGASQVPLDFSFQKFSAKQAHMKPTMEETAVPDTKPYQHPNCQLLNDGTGYKLEHISSASLYSHEGLTPLSGTTIFFK